MDGQLWKETDLREAAYYLPPSSLLTLLSLNQGAYIRTLALHGWRDVPANAFAVAMGHAPGKGLRPATSQLRKLDLQGCTSLTAAALESIIVNSSELEWLSLRGLHHVDHNVVEAIRGLSMKLKHLDLSYCRPIPLMDEGIFNQGDSWPFLKTLKLGGGSGGHDVLEALADAAASLETLDLSYSSIDDADILSFVTLPPSRYPEAFVNSKSGRNRNEDDELGALMLTPSQAGELDNTYPCDGMVPRRVTKLRHLNISHCPHITQDAAAYLAYAVPLLEILEMAGVGEMSSDDGIVALFQTTPRIRKIDIDGATMASDLVLSALTPSRVESAGPGHQLEVLSIGQCTRMTSDAALKLLRACPKLLDINVEVSVANDGL